MCHAREDPQAVGSSRCTRAVSEHLVSEIGAVEKQVHGIFQLVSARMQSDCGRGLMLTGGFDSVGFVSQASV